MISSSRLIVSWFIFSFKAVSNAADEINRNYFSSSAAFLLRRRV